MHSEDSNRDRHNLPLVGNGTHHGHSVPSTFMSPLRNPDPHGAHDGGEIPLREYLGVLVKYRFVIGLCILIFALGAMIYSFTATPLYTASSKVRISTYEPVLAATKIEDMLQQKSKEANYVETQLEELRSFSLADRVLLNDDIRNYMVERLKLKESELKSVAIPGGAGYKAPVVLIRGYLNNIQIKPVRRTALVGIEATAANPEIAALMAYNHALAYIDWVRSSRVEQQSRAVKFLRGQADELREKVADLEREMADYAEANSIVAVNKDENIVAQKMAKLNELLTDVTAKRIEAENSYTEAESSLSIDSAGNDDASTQTMRSELAKLESEYQQLSVKFMPGYPRMQQLRSQIQGLKDSILNQRKQIVKGMKAKALALSEQEKSMREELEQQKSRAFELSKKQVQYNILNREVTSSRELLENVLKQIKETSLSVESNSSNISIVDAPVVPEKPSFPRKGMMVMLGILLGVGTGIGLAFLLNYLDSSIRTPDEVMNYLKLPSLGVVPSFDLDDTTKQLPDLNDPLIPTPGDGMALPVVKNKDDIAPVLFVANPRSIAAEAYRTIRTGILLSQAGEPPRSMLVTSAQSAEGKTTSSVNLAASLASSGARVVLIDADLRRPAVSKQFGLDSNLPGLVDILTGQRSFEEVAVRDLIKRITVVPAGQIPPNPAELLGSYEMLGLLRRLSSEFDYVLVDSPPVLPVTDSVVLSRFVDGVVLVVRAAKTPRKIVAEAKNRLNAVGARVLGTVLNDLNFTKSGYYYYNRYYKAYYKDSAA